jgi:hypothetical protein
MSKASGRTARRYGCPGTMREEVEEVEETKEANPPRRSPAGNRKCTGSCTVESQSKEETRSSVQNQSRKHVYRWKEQVWRLDPVGEYIQRDSI